MDPVLSGSLCFLVLAIAMYLKFIREQPWSDEEMLDHKSSPVDKEENDDDDDAMPFLNRTSSTTRLQTQQQKRGQGRQQIQQVETTQPQLLQPHHGYGGFQSSRQVTSLTVAPAAVDVTATSGANYLPQSVQPMRRRTHSATAAATTASSNNEVKSTAVDGELVMDQLPTTIYEEVAYDKFSQQKQPQDSGRNQHRITFDDYDEELGFLSSPRYADRTNISLESVSFEAESDGFYDLESHRPEDHRPDNHRPEDHLLYIAASERALKPIQIGGLYRGGDLLGSSNIADASSDAKTLKTNIERHFVRDVAPPAQMQLQVARKARIPLFLHSPMYVRTSATPLVDEVDAKFTAELVDETQAEQNAANREAQAQLSAGLSGAAGAGGAVDRGVADVSGNTRRKRPKLSKVKNDSLHVDFEELQIEEMIGQGAFGTVHRAKWRGTAVAVKILVCQHLTADILGEFEAEVQIMSILRYCCFPCLTINALELNGMSNCWRMLTIA